MPLLFHTLLPSEILDKHHLSASGNSCTCFSLAVHCFCRGSPVHQGSGRTVPHQAPLLCPEWQNLAEEQPLAQTQEQLQFLRTWHFEKWKYFEMLFLFPHWDSMFPEEREQEQHLWGPGMDALHRGKNWAELSPETGSGHPLGGLF